ncbi:hypothetical protein AB4059_02315 [Lysobacter sp. 2RAF19]
MKEDLSEKFAQLVRGRAIKMEERRARAKLKQDADRRFSQAFVVAVESVVIPAIERATRHMRTVDTSITVEHSFSAQTKLLINFTFVDDARAADALFSRPHVTIERDEELRRVRISTSRPSGWINEVETSSLPLHRVTETLVAELLVHVVAGFYE